jgi:hypothetical protein
MEATAPARGASADGWRKAMEKLAAAVRWIAVGVVILVASFVVGGLYQGVAISNGNSAGDVYVFNRFTGTYYVCRNRSCQMGKVSN